MIWRYFESLKDGVFYFSEYMIYLIQDIFSWIKDILRAHNEPANVGVKN